MKIINLPIIAIALMFANSPAFASSGLQALTMVTQMKSQNANTDTSQSSAQQTEMIERQLKLRQPPVAPQKLARQTLAKPDSKAAKKDDQK